MAELRIRIELQRPDKGIEMSKLSALAEETQKFLRMVAEDAGMNPDEGTWVARDFYNQGVGFNAEYQFAEIEQAQVLNYLNLVQGITEASAENQWSVPRVRPTTVLQSAKIATIADEGETVRVGFLNGHDVVRDWRPLAKPKATAIIEYFEAWVDYRGMLQGVIHSIFKEVNPPCFTLRDFASRTLVRCEFAPGLWEDVHKALQRKDAAVFVGGWIRAKRIDKAISCVTVERIEGTQPLSRQQLLSLFGSAPGWAGDMTAEQFIDSIRGEDDAE